MLARAHQRQFDLVLDVFNMEGAAAGAVADQGVDDLGGQRFHQFAHAGGRGALAAIHGQECLGHGDGDLVGFEPDHRAIAANDVVAGPLPAVVGGRIGLRGRHGRRPGHRGDRSLHGSSCAKSA
ncbi:hypothetical protein D9M70_544600 [compost metagenome]